MVDLETLGTRPGSVILSLGAVEFDAHAGLGREFYVELSQYASRHAGFTTDPETVGWGEGQSDAARGLVERTGGGGEVPHRALREFNEWLPPDPLVWGNGVAFDNALLAEAYARCWLRPRWSFRDDRCYRTLKSLLPQVERVRPSVPHHALEDARSQAEHAVRLLRELAARGVTVE